jgi:membrane protein YqaA with SNARE-associated domain
VFRQWYAQWGLWVILIKGMTPIPYKLVTIASGLAAFSFPMFMAASVVTRGGRFFLAAFLVKRYGPRVEHLIERRIYTIASIVVAVAVLGFIAVRLIH